MRGIRAKIVTVLTDDITHSHSIGVEYYVDLIISTMTVFRGSNGVSDPPARIVLRRALVKLLAPGWLGPDGCPTCISDLDGADLSSVVCPSAYPASFPSTSLLLMRVYTLTCSIPRIHAQIARTQLERLITARM